ncbi:MAG: hypothetical protein Q7T91_12700 [Sulfuricurvum sp.]|nr:hypothetical protein [Sulfuricurvum sp.]
MEANTTILNTPGQVVQHTYLVAALKLLERYGAMRRHTIGYGLFPGRPLSAARAAIERVLCNAKKQGFVREQDWMNSQRYYALSTKGARFLNTLDEDWNASSNVATLRLHNKEHREWSQLIAMASEHRGWQGISEPELKGGLYNDITNYFGHMPDALTLVKDKAKAGGLAIWHEVELSRRSTTRKETSPKMMCGVEKLAHLVQVMRDKHHLIYKKEEYMVALMLHCATDKIEREVRGVIEQSCAMNVLCKTGQGYEVGFKRPGGESLQILVNRLAATHEEGWDKMPWSWAGGSPRGVIDIFTEKRLPADAGGSSSDT